MACVIHLQSLFLSSWTPAEKPIFFASLAHILCIDVITDKIYIYCVTDLKAREKLWLLCVYLWGKVEVAVEHAETKEGWEK